MAVSIKPRAAEAPPAAIAGRTFAALGTTVGVWTTEPGLLSRLDRFLRDWMSRVEASCSRFQATSDLSRANAAAGSAVHVGPELLGAAQGARMMAELTDGLYDPTVGVAVVNAGYDRTFEAIVAEGPGRRGPAQPGAWWMLEVDVSEATITVPEGYALDLGGSAKGWSVDMGVAGLSGTILAEHPLAGVCIGAGGDIAVAGPPPPGGWPVRVAERLDGGARPGDAELRLRRGAMATSGPGLRSWARPGGREHHLIDPRTGNPGRSAWSLVTILADSCLVADGAAKAAWLLDGDAPDWVEDQGLAARLVHRDGREVVVGDLERWVAGGVRPWR